MKLKLRTILQHRAFVPGVILLGTLLMVGALNNGLLLDDYLHRMMIGTTDAPHWLKAAPWDVFRLIPSNPDFVRNSHITGINPWWGADEYQATFFRPISSLNMYLDYLLWPNSPFLMHLHSMLWFVVMCLAAWKLFSQLIPDRHLVALATAFFALDDAHFYPAAWIANRNSMIAATLAFSVLWLHICGQRNQWRPGKVAAPFMLAVALLAGEFALGICGFLFAHAVFMEEGTFREKLMRLLPYAGVVVLWRIAYDAMGYGVWGSDLYVDPLHNPWAFFEMVLMRLPVLLQSGFGLGGAEISTFIPNHAHWWLTAAASVIVLFFWWVLRPHFKKNNRFRFLLTGTVLSLIPSCATFSHDRLLLIASIGIFASLALFVKPLFEHESQAARHRHFSKVRSVMPTVWLLLHGVVSPASIPVKAEIPNQLNTSMDAITRSLPADLNDKTVVIVAAPDMFTSSFLPLWRDAIGLSSPKHTLALYNGADPLTVIRESNQSLTLEVKEGMLGVWTDALVRRKADRFEVGQHILRASTRFTILKVDANGNPTRVRATFTRPLDDNEISFWYWTPTAFRKFNLPSRGDETTITVDPLSVLLK